MTAFSYFLFCDFNHCLNFSLFLTKPGGIVILGSSLRLISSASNLGVNIGSGSVLLFTAPLPYTYTGVLLLQLSSA